MTVAAVTLQLRCVLSVPLAITDNTVMCLVVTTACSVTENTAYAVFAQMACSAAIALAYARRSARVLVHSQTVNA